MKGLLQKNKELYENLTIKGFIEQKIVLAEERAFDPYYIGSIEEEFNCNITEEFFEYKQFLRENIKYLEKQLEEKEIKEVYDINELEPVEEVEGDDLEYIIRIQLKNNYIKIEEAQGFYPDDQVWIYKNFFGLDINNREELEQAEQRGIFREMMSW